MSSATQASTRTTLTSHTRQSSHFEWIRDPSIRGIVFPILGIVAMVIYFSVAAPAFWTVTNLTDVLRDGAVLLIVAIGQTWVIQMGSIDLSNGAIVVLAGLVSATWLEGNSLWVAAAVALACGLVAGVVNGLLLAYVGLPSFLVTLGTSLALTGAGLLYAGGQTIPILDEHFINISQGTLLLGIPNIVLWSIALFLIAAFVGFRTKFGRYMAVIGGGETVARLCGVPVRRFKIYAFTVSGVLAAVGGILTAARFGSGSPGVGSEVVLLSVAAVVMSGTPLTGGRGGAHRTILGVLVITILEDGMTAMNVGPFTQSIIEGCVVIVAVALTLDRSKLSIAK